MAVRPLKAVILAAGYATRLYPLTENRPKCLLMVAGRTILDSIVDKIEALDGLEELIIVTNAKFFSKLESWKNGRKSKAKVSVLNDGTLSNDTRLGATGDLNFTIDKKSVKTDMLVLASDNLFEEDLLRFVDFARSKKEAPSVAIYDIKDPNAAANKFGVFEVDKNFQITALEEKPPRPKTSLIGMGLYYFPQDSLKFIKEYLKSKDAKDAPGHYIRWLLQKTKIFGFLFKGLWYDIGDLAALEEANKIFSVKSSK